MIVLGETQVSKTVYRPCAPGLLVFTVRSCKTFALQTMRASAVVAILAHLLHLINVFVGFVSVPMYNRTS